MALLFFLPLVNLLMVLSCCFAAGCDSENSYGPDPREERAEDDDLRRARDRTVARVVQRPRDL